MDRRKPLGGVEKDTFVHSADDAVKNAELTYDLLAGLRNDLCFKIEDIKKQCTCRVNQCNDRFSILEKRKKWDFTVSAVMGIIGGASAVIAKMTFWK